MIREQEEIGREAEEKAWRESYDLGAPQLELTPEDEAALDRAWARVAAEKAPARESLRSGFMPATYAGRPILTPEEFSAEQAAGWFDSEANYDDYLAMIRAQEEIKREAEEKARREGYELGAPQIELTPEDEAILDRVWAKRAAEKAAAEAVEKADDKDEQLAPARTA